MDGSALGWLKREAPVAGAWGWHVRPPPMMAGKRSMGPGRTGRRLERRMSVSRTVGEILAEQGVRQTIAFPGRAGDRLVTGDEGGRR